MDRLAMAASAALAAGMSYGKWKALNPNWEPPKEKPPEKIKGYCKCCGTPIPADSKRFKYCSDECADKRSAELYRERHPKGANKVKQMEE